MDETYKILVPLFNKELEEMNIGLRPDEFDIRIAKAKYEYTSSFYHVFANHPEGGSFVWWNVSIDAKGDVTHFSPQLIKG